MSCSQCQGIEKEFDRKYAMKELERYRQNGPSKTTQMLLDTLEKLSVEGMTLLDIGGGVGAIQHALLDAGVVKAIHVDASSGYLDAAQQEADRRGIAARIDFHHGDFVQIAKRLSPVGIVSLDRVLCCYDDMPAMVKVSTSLAEHYYALVYPRDASWMNWFAGIANLYLKLRKNPFRIFIHPSRVVENMIERSGFRRIFHTQTLIWQIAVYSK